MKRKAKANVNLCSVVIAELCLWEDYGIDLSGSTFGAWDRKEGDLQQPAWIY